MNKQQAFFVKLATHITSMKKTTAFAILLLLCLRIIAQQGNTKGWPQEDQKTFESANKLFNKKYYNAAYEKYKSLIPNHEKDVFLKFVTGVCAVHINDKLDEAELFFNEVKTQDKKNKDIDYYFALLYHKTYQFDKALELANGLLTNPKITPEDKTELERLVFFSKNGKEICQTPVETKIENLGSPINTENAEYAPVITPDEESIIFTYRGKESMGGLVDMNNKPDPKGDYNEDIFIAGKSEKIWQKPAGLNELNTIANDAAIALSPDGQQLFVFKVTGDNGDIYVSKRESGKFGLAEKLAGEVNSNSWEGSVSLSTDQKKLFFASDRPGGFGGKDLYVATKKEDGTWGNIKNLGDKINTKYDEDAPFISPDNRTLVFSSEGHNSIGDFDLFTSDWNKEDSSWQTPKNLGYPINTTDDDLFYVLSPDGKRGYFSSARKGGKGDQDLYVVEPAIAAKKTYITIIKGKVTENLVPFESEISVSAEGETKNYGTYYSNKESGNYVVNLPSGKNYKLTFYHPVLGDKKFNINTEQVEDYAEKLINVNFGTSDTSTFNPQTVVVSPGMDTSKVTSNTKPVSVLSETDLLNKYGDRKIKGIYYYVQLAASMNPDNFDTKPIRKIGPACYGGVLTGDVKLLILKQEFRTLNDAYKILQQVREAGVKDAFVTAKVNGKRHYLTDLIRMKVWDGK